MKRTAVALALIAIIAGRLYATPPGFPITNSAHDFVTFRGTASGYTVNGQTYSARNRCTTCHAAHRATRNFPLWGRQSPDTSGWIVWNADQTGVAGNAVSSLHQNADGSFMTGQLLDPNLEATDPSLVDAVNNPAGMEYLSATELVNTGTGLCMSCHDGQTAIGSSKSGASVTMDPNFAGNWGRDLSNMHPVGKYVPFGTPGWQASLTSGNAYSGSNVVVESKSTVGCTSCHSMHSSSNSSMILRGGQRCLSCHDR